MKFIQLEGEEVFACLEVLECQSGIFHELFSILSGPKVESQICSTCGAEFLLIRAATRKGKIDWQKIEQCAGRFAGKMLLPTGWTLSARAGLRCTPQGARISSRWKLPRPPGSAGFRWNLRSSRPSFRGKGILTFQGSVRCRGTPGRSRWSPPPKAPPFTIFCA